MTRDELVAAVLADPAALFAVESARMSVAGPWVEFRPSYWHRVGSVSGVYGSVAFVSEDREGFRADVVHPPGLGITEHASLQAAQEWCDARLRSAAIVLVDG